MVAYPDPPLVDEAVALRTWTEADLPDLDREDATGLARELRCENAVTGSDLEHEVPRPTFACRTSWTAMARLARKFWPYARRRASRNERARRAPTEDHRERHCWNRNRTGTWQAPESAGGGTMYVMLRLSVPSDAFVAAATGVAQVHRPRNFCAVQSSCNHH